MTIKIEFDTDGEVFEDPVEISMILIMIADVIKNGSKGGKIRDVNGDEIGMFRLER